MSVAIEVRVSNGDWFLLADGVKNRQSVLEGWLDLARDLYPVSEVRIVDEVSNTVAVPVSHH